MTDILVVVKLIFIADRGYENYNIFAHANENKLYYLIRAKDLSSNGIVFSLRDQLPKDEMTFDKSVSITLTRKQTNQVKANREKYRIIMKATPFDYLDLHIHKFYDLQMRIVRFPISENTYESIITNLSASDFFIRRYQKAVSYALGNRNLLQGIEICCRVNSFSFKKNEQHLAGNLGPFNSL